jgi:hypothetical protein
MNDLRRSVATMLRLRDPEIPVERMRNVPVDGFTIDSPTFSWHEL